METDKRNTFIANIRCDLRDIATIAKFLHEQDIFVQTKARIASEAVRIIARGVMEEGRVKTFSEAVVILKNLGYDSCMKDNTRYYRKLKNALNIEQTKIEYQDVTEGLIRQEQESAQNQVQTQNITPDHDPDHDNTDARNAFAYIPGAPVEEES